MQFSLFALHSPMIRHYFYGEFATVQKPVIPFGEFFGYKYANISEIVNKEEIFRKNIYQIQKNRNKFSSFFIKHWIFSPYSVIMSYRLVYSLNFRVFLPLLIAFTA